MLEKVYLCEVCENCFECINAQNSGNSQTVIDINAALCTKYKLSYWLSFGDETCEMVSQLVNVYNNWTCKFQFSYAVDNDNVKDKMHHIAAYIIQHAFRCGWDYRRALED